MVDKSHALRKNQFDLEGYLERSIYLTKQLLRRQCSSEPTEVLVVWTSTYEGRMSKQIDVFRYDDDESDGGDDSRAVISVSV